jgi:hypothetical protein
MASTASRIASQTFVLPILGAAVGSVVPCAAGPTGTRWDRRLGVVVETPAVRAQWDRGGRFCATDGRTLRMTGVRAVSSGTNRMRASASFDAGGGARAAATRDLMLRRAPGRAFRS